MATQPNNVSESNQSPVLSPRKPTGLTAKGDKRQYVQHSYTDRSNDIVENITTSDENTLRLYREDSVGGPFPLKLQIVLKVTEKLGQQSIISWLPHGRSFMIHRPREFEQEVMGKFFKQTKLTSFRRQLNLYDFQRISHGRDAGSYYHELFHRGRPLLAKRMVRRKVKGTKIRASSSPDDEPNFYTMAFMTPTTAFHGNGYGGRGGMMHDPSMFGGAGMGGVHNLGFPMAGGLMNHHDPHQFRNNQHLLQQQQLQQQQGYGAISNQHAFQQNPAMYAELIAQQAAANRMSLSQLGGSMDHLNFPNSFVTPAAYQRNNLASLGMTESERLGPESRFHQNPSLLNREAGLYDNMAGMRSLQAAASARDPRLAHLNESMLGPGSGGGNGNGYPNLQGMSSMVPNGPTSLSGSALFHGQHNTNSDLLNSSVNNSAAAASFQRQSMLMQQQDNEFAYSQLQMLRSPQGFGAMSSMPNKQNVGPNGLDNINRNEEDASKSLLHAVNVKQKQIIDKSAGLSGEEDKVDDDDDSNNGESL